MAGTKKRRARSNANRFAIFPVAVSKVQRISENYIRISLTGPSLHAFADPVNAGEGEVLDAFVKLLVPPPGETRPTDIELNEDWRSQWFCRPEHERGWMRTYTLRACRRVLSATAPKVTASLRTSTMLCASLPLPEELPDWQPEVDIDFVLHADADGTVGPGARWALGAQVGDMISFFGPLSPEPLWTTWQLGESKRVIVCVDETGVPAALSIASSLPEGVRADILCELPSVKDMSVKEYSLVKPEIIQRDDVCVHWLARSADTPRGELLCRELCKVLELSQLHEQSEKAESSDGSCSVIWEIAENESETYVFIAGESTTVRSLRRICVNEAGVDKKSISFMGYWKEGCTES